MPEGSLLYGHPTVPNAAFATAAKRDMKAPNPVSRLTHSITSNLRELGWLDGSLFLIARTLESLTGGRARMVRYHIVAQPIPALPTTPGRAAPTDSHFGFCSLETCDPQDFPRPQAVIEARFAKGHRCLRATQKGRFAGYLWLAHGHYDEDEVRCRYTMTDPQASVWDYDVYVAPEFRIGRTFARLWQHANEDLSRAGVRWSFSRISAFNPGSLRAHSRLGATSLTSITFVCLGSAQIAFTPSAPFIRVTLGQGSAPELRLAPPS